MLDWMQQLTPEECKTFYIAIPCCIALFIGLVYFFKWLEKDSPFDYVTETSEYTKPNESSFKRGSDVRYTDDERYGDSRNVKDDS
jgi:hypothetical protein